MHLPDGFLSTPVSLTTAALAAGAIGLALQRTRDRFQDRQAPLIGVTAAFVFAAQMINYPIGFGASGHVLGAMLAALLLGPLAACLVMALVIVLQCLLFADGGLSALGANILNMGVIAALGPWLLRAGLLKILPRAWTTSRRGFLALAGFSAWLSMLLASAACAGELVLSGTTGAAPIWIFGLLTGIHAVIGLGEAILTMAVLSAVLAARPEWIHGWTDLTAEPLPAANPRKPEGPLWAGALAAVLAVALLLAPLASTAPDGLEHTAAQFNLPAADAPASATVLLPDYTVPGLNSPFWSAGLAGALGVGAVFLLTLGLTRLVRQRRAVQREGRG